MSSQEDDSHRASEGAQWAADALSAIIVSRVIPLTIIVAATVLAGVWRLPEARLWVVETLGSRQSIDLESALADPSEAVATSACEHMLTSERLGATPISYDALYQRPAIALACLDRIKKTEPAETAEPDTDEYLRDSQISPVTRVQLIATRLGRRWLADVGEGRAKSCEFATSAKRALDFAGTDSTSPLLHCAVGAESSEARRCCVEALGGKEQFATLLDSPHLVSLARIEDGHEALVRAVFKEAKSDADDMAEGEDASLNALMTKKQDWVVEVSCRLHHRDPARRQVVRSFLSMIESPGCAPSEVPWQGYYEAQNWSMVCGGMYEHRRTQMSMEPRQALCESLKAASIAEAVGATRLSVNAAVTLGRQESDGYQSSMPLVGVLYSDEPVAAYATGRSRRRRTASPRATTMSRQILSSMGRQLFQ